MEKSKNIPTLRFREFDGEWKKTKFDDILEITRLAGYEYSTYWQEDENKEIIALRGYNIGKGKLELNNLGYISKELSLKLIRSKLFKGDIVYPCVGTIGNAVVIEEDDKYHIQQNIAKITPKENISPYFITQFLMSDLGLNEVYKFNATSSQPNVLVGSLRNFEITLPPSLSEQSKIAKFLSVVGDKLQTLKQKKTLLKQYKKGVMQKIFSQELRFKDDNGNEYTDWEDKKLGNCLDYIQPTKYLVSSTEYDNLYSTPVLTAGKTFILGYTNETNGIFANNLPVIIFDDFTTATQFVDFPFKAKSSAMKILVAKEGINIRFMYETMQIMKYELGGHERHWISKFAPFEILIPSTEEQTKIANFLSAIDDKIKHCQTQIEKTEVWKKGLMQQMFV